ncbi:MAG: hypothetical protein ACFUZC_14870 [Chthoniobacteraceae bacterium]
MLADLVLCRETLLSALMCNAPGLLANDKTLAWLDKLLTSAVERLAYFRVRTASGEHVEVHPFAAEYCAPALALFAVPETRGEWLDRGFRTSGKSLLAAVELLLFAWQEIDICARMSPREIADNARLAPILRLYRIIR